MIFLFFTHNAKHLLAFCVARAMIIQSDFLLTGMQAGLIPRTFIPWKY